MMKLTMMRRMGMLRMMIVVVAFKSARGHQTYPARAAHRPGGRLCCAARGATRAVPAGGDWARAWRCSPVRPSGLVVVKGGGGGGDVTRRHRAANGHLETPPARDGSTSFSGTCPAAPSARGGGGGASITYRERWCNHLRWWNPLRVTLVGRGGGPVYTDTVYRYSLPTNHRCDFIPNVDALTHLLLYRPTILLTILQYYWQNYNITDIITILLTILQYYWHYYNITILLTILQYYWSYYNITALLTILQYYWQYYNITDIITILQHYWQYYNITDMTDNITRLLTILHYWQYYSRLLQYYWQYYNITDNITVAYYTITDNITIILTIPQYYNITDNITTLLTILQFYTHHR